MVSRLFSAFIMLVYLLSASASNTPPSGAYKGCAAEGKGGDSQLNVLKNRSEQVPNPKPMTMADILALPAPSGVEKVNRSQWPASALATVAEHEKEGVIVEGFWVQVRPEGLEATNCDDPTLHDFHLWLVESSGQQKPKSMVTEMTPRWRGSNAGWNQKAIQRLISQGAKFRVTGWLLFDQEHPEQINKFRATLWEIHPITKVEVFSGGKWREL